MARWLDDVWQPTVETSLPRSDRRHGPYRQYAPDRIGDRSLLVDAAVAHKATTAEQMVRALSTGPGATSLEGLSRFLLRSEAIASSQIEGIAPSPQQVALAELGQDEQVRGFTEQARLVANNITLLRRAATELAHVEQVTVADVEALHRALLPQERHQGLRTVQNWIGGSNWHPLDADFVPPPAARVRPLMEDLIGYINGSVHAPLVQAALVHAQFETIHPFTDGNGRVGRALIHTVLTRRGLTPSALLPVSLVLATIRETYVAGLTAYRYDGSAEDAPARRGVSAWLDVFLDATQVAARQASGFAADAQALTEEWERRLRDHREGLGLRGTPRTDSVAARLLVLLPELPILTARTVERVLAVSYSVARSGVEELAEAGILTRRSVERGTTGYAAMDVFGLVGHAERQLASTRWDTRLSPPSRPVPSVEVERAP